MSKSLLRILFFCVATSTAVHAAQPAIKTAPDIKSTWTKGKEVVEEVKERMQSLLTNPFFLAAAGCFVYAGPREIVRAHPLLSVMAAGLILSYFKGDFECKGVDGVEVNVRLLRSRSEQPEVKTTEA